MGTDPDAQGGQGHSVALSADGNTALVGGTDFNSLGAAWVYTRGGGVWTQQGAKLVGTGAVGPLGTRQGFSIALSADGNTALVGGPIDDDFAGAAWVFTRSGGVWTQQGAKLVGSGAVGSPLQGISVALSGDGNTALVGGPYDNFTGAAYAGAAWVFTRSGGVWTQQGAKLVGSGAVGFAEQGTSVALSGDGNTALVGGPYDDSHTFPASAYTRGRPSDIIVTAVGAAWVFTRAGGVWTQQGAKLVGTGALGFAEQGISVALSANGNTALVGGPSDDGLGAAWVYSATAPGPAANDIPTLAPMGVLALGGMLLFSRLLLLRRRV